MIVVDPHEDNNLAGSRRDVVETMVGEIRSQLAGARPHNVAFLQGRVGQTVHRAWAVVKMACALVMAAGVSVAITRRGAEGFEPE